MIFSALVTTNQTTSKRNSVPSLKKTGLPLSVYLANYQESQISSSINGVNSQYNWEILKINLFHLWRHASNTEYIIYFITISWPEQVFLRYPHLLDWIFWSHLQPFIRKVPSHHIHFSLIICYVVKKFLLCRN